MFNYQSQDQGYLILSISASDGTEYGAYSIDFQSEKGDFGRVNYFQNNIFYKSEREFDDKDSNGVIKVETMKPGRYEIVNWSVSKANEDVSWSARENFSIPFEIKSNKVTYIGEYQAHKTEATNLLGMTVQSFAVFTINDESERDINFAKNNNLIPTVSIIKNVPEKNAFYIK
ncbi:hypothetical protein EA58_01125 [Photobacterium galatheae]|uniref:Uncharacterized protein n=2 Tax=Photobacterium galatheae TaxID=1654360 RepID=A0A066RWK6_9GAMM|nr:hypothetical protein EA58_01125 [Photobacterium galatheae]